MADRSGYTQVIERARGRLLGDSCPAMSRVAPEGTRVFATDSAKQAHYLPAILGIEVGEVSPEAARGGPLALVRDGDLIRIDVPARTADLNVLAAEVQRRRDALRRRPAPKSGAGSPSTSAWSVPSRRAPCCESQPHRLRRPGTSYGSAGAAAALRTAPALVVTA